MSIVKIYKKFLIKIKAKDLPKANIKSVNPSRTCFTNVYMELFPRLQAQPSAL